MKQLMKCQICGKMFSDPPALSRKDNKTQICPDCGTFEALEAYYNATGRSKEDLEKAKETVREMIGNRTENGA